VHVHSKDALWLQHVCRYDVHNSLRIPEHGNSAPTRHRVKPLLRILLWQLQVRDVLVAEPNSALDSSLCSSA
jgi:hypothetical protein